MMETTQTELSGLYSDLKYAEKHLSADLVQRAINDLSKLSQLEKERDEFREISDMYEEGISKLEHGIMSTGVRKHLNKLLDTAATLRNEGE